MELYISILFGLMIATPIILIWRSLGIALLEDESNANAMIWPIILLRKRREPKELDARERWLAHEQEMRNHQLDRALELALAQREVSSKHRRKKRTTKRKPRKKQDKTVVVETRLEL